MAESAQQGDKLNVFISYSRDDLAFADQLDAALGLAGFGATIDRQGISAGEDWQTRLGALIRDLDNLRASYSLNRCGFTILVSLHGERGSPAMALGV